MGFGVFCPSCGIVLPKSKRASFSPSEYRCRWEAGVGSRTRQTAPGGTSIFGEGPRDALGGCDGGERPHWCRTCGELGSITPRCVRRYGARSTMPCCLGFPQGIEFKEADRMRTSGGRLLGARRGPSATQCGSFLWDDCGREDGDHGKSFLWTADGREGDQTARPSNSRSANVASSGPPCRRL